MKRIIMFLAGILVAGSIGVALGWPSGHGLIPRADLAHKHGATPSPSPAPDADRGRLRLPVRPAPSLSPNLAPTTAPTPSATPYIPAPAPTSQPLPSYAPVPTPWPTPVHSGCGGCGHWQNTDAKGAVMCPMTTDVYCIDATQ